MYGPTHPFIAIILISRESIKTIWEDCMINYARVVFVSLELYLLHLSLLQSRWPMHQTIITLCFAITNDSMGFYHSIAHLIFY